MSELDSNLGERRVLLTGATSGIGRATAKALAQRGYALWLTYTSNEGDARDTVEACAPAAAEVRLSQLDLRSPASIAALWDEVGREWTALHAVVNNGAVCPYVPYDGIELDGWDAVLETNARGTFLMIRSALPLLRAATGDRSIVNVSSVAGQVGAITSGVHYAASKAAVLAITRSFARILAPERIRVNAVSPGPIESAITAHLMPEARAALERGVPLGGFGQPEDVAPAIVLLASPDSAYTTGATYDVNGGVRID
jgi:3-oxoacyl-[acyl-carrier protein] reductase